MGGPDYPQQYRPDIDGLRALAVVPVVLYHAGVPGFAGGFTGVDIFFVISGYLLTGILLREIAAGQFSLARFYVRRARRILPALAVVVAATLAAGFFLQAPEQFAQTGRAARAVATISANILFERVRADYWLQSTLAGEPLLHTWSLAVEEQFYVVLPLLLWATAAWKLHRVAHPRASWVAILGLLALASFAWAEWLLRHAGAGQAFFLLAPRAWELLAGCLLAVATMHGAPPPNRLANPISFAGLVLIAMGVFLLRDGTHFPGFGAALPCTGAVLVIHGGRSATAVVRRVLSWPPLVFIGLISYSIYLWHWPVLVFLQSVGWFGRGLPAVPLPLQIALVLVLAWVSWRLVEQPFRRIGAARRKPHIVIVTALATLAALFAGGELALRIGEHRGPVAQDVPPLVAALSADQQATPGLACEGSADPALIRRTGGGCLVGAPMESPAFVLLGDSHARMYTEAVAALGRRHGLSVLVMARSSCVPALGVIPPTRPGCVELTRASIDFLLHSPVQRIVLAGYWIDLISSPAEAAALAAGLDRTVAALVGAGKRVYLVEDVPELPHDDSGYQAAIRSMRLQGGPIRAITLDGHRLVQAPATRILEDIARRRGAIVLSAASQLCDPVQGCLAAEHGRSVYRDRHHLTDAAAAALMQPLFAPVLRGMTGP